MTERPTDPAEPTRRGERDEREGRPEPDEGPAELGLRERKKRETRLRISDIATGLFLMRGFDNVTIAEVARAADVSINTVFNYFRTKEDLFFDRQEEIAEQARRSFDRRRPGESAAALFRRVFVEGLDAGAHQTGFHEGSEIWAKTVMDSPALTAKQREIMQRAQDALAERLAEETGADPDDLAPRMAAAMIFAAQTVLIGEIIRRKLAGQSLGDMRQEVYASADRVYDLLEHGLADYAVRPGGTQDGAGGPADAAGK